MWLVWQLSPMTFLFNFRQRKIDRESNPIFKEYIQYFIPGSWNHRLLHQHSTPVGSFDLRVQVPCIFINQKMKIIEQIIACLKGRNHALRVDLYIKVTVTITMRVWVIVPSFLIEEIENPKHITGRAVPLLQRIDEAVSCFPLCSVRSL